MIRSLESEIVYSHLTLVTNPCISAMPLPQIEAAVIGCSLLWTWERITKRWIS